MPQDSKRSATRQVGPNANDLTEEAIEETIAILRDQAEVVLAQIAELEVVAEQMIAGGGRQAREHFIAAVRQHSLDCAIKMGWAAAAVEMYRDALKTHSAGEAEYSE